MIAEEKLLELLEASRDDLRSRRKDADLQKMYSNCIRHLTTCWRQQAQDFMSQLKELRGEFREAPTRVRLSRAWDEAVKRGTKRLARGLEKEIAEGLRRGAASALTDLKIGPQIGVGFRLDEPQVQRWINDRVKFVTESLNETSRSQILNLVQRLDEKGLTYNQITKEVRKEIRSWHAGAGETRAQLTAFTELGTGYEEGRLHIVDQFNKAGVRIEKRWILVADASTCNICESALADDWIPQQAVFANGFDAPLAHPGCRCDVELTVV